MTAYSNPFPLPERLEADLARVLSFWQELRRAENSMPFWDDLTPSALAQRASSVLLIDVFAKPERFRFNHISESLAQRYNENLAHKFADEIDLRAPFAFLRAQASATVEARAPTYYRSDAGGGPGFARLLLPMWGDGRISMLLGALEMR
jgi:hypothetical protein